MSQESIWEKSLSGEVSKPSNPSILIKRTFAYPLTDLHLRNYLSSHSVNDISLDSLYDYFRENLFNDFNGLYLPHLLCMMDYIPYDKIYKALDEVFQVISPNMGSLTEMNYNYFQFFLLVMRKDGTFFLQSRIKELYDLGLKHGLDVLYHDMNNRLMNIYYATIASFDDILVNYEHILIPKGVDLNSLCLEDVLVAMDYRLVKNASSYYLHEDKKIESHILYSEMLQYMSEEYVEECFIDRFSEEKDAYDEVKKYIKRYINDKESQK